MPEARVAVAVETVTVVVGQVGQPWGEAAYGSPGWVKQAGSETQASLPQVSRATTVPL